MAMADPTTKIRLRGVRKRFYLRRRQVDALAGIELEVRDGEFFSIVGPSGCGKTTLLRILAGLERDFEGTIEMTRESIRSDASGSRDERPLNAMVFQERSIFPWMNVRDNVAFGLKARGFASQVRYAIADTHIRKVGLSGFEDALPHQLSGGMQQRVSIARAFANDPEILLMDEPFAALDEQNRLILQGELLRVWEEARKTVVYVTHSIDEAIVLADRIMVMTARPGQIKAIIDVGQVFGRPRRVEEVKASREYGELFGRIWGLLRDEVATASAQHGGDLERVVV
jgi:NitT/TauT family transport system ATP-binding protein